MGVLSRARSIRRSNTDTPMVDNYEDFLGRIAVTRQALDQQHSQLLKRTSFLRSQWSYERNSASVWESRSTSLTEALVVYRGSADGYQRLADLTAVAEKLHNASKNRHESIDAALKATNERREALAESIKTLESSRIQLETSRKLGLAMESLTRAAANTHVGMNGVTPVGGTGELREMKLLVAQAEALVELKGW